MGLEEKFKSGRMTTYAGIEDNNGTNPTPLPQPNLDPNSFKNGSISYGYKGQGKATGSELDLEDSGPAPEINGFKQQWTDSSENGYDKNKPQ